MELYEEEALNHICEEVDLDGINNRDLRTFNVDINRSLALVKKPDGKKALIAESGIQNPGRIPKFRDAGFTGFLMGETYMKYANPGLALSKFVEQLK